MQYALAPVGQEAFGFFPLHAVPARLRSPHGYDQAHLARFQRTRNQVLQDLDELVFRHLRVDVDAKTPVKILLRGKHLAQATLVLFDRFALVGEGDFRIDHERKIHDNELAQNPGESGIREVFQADPRIEQTADLEVVILFIFDVHVRHLASGALVPE